VKLGVTLRSMGPESTAQTLLACTLAAEAAGLDDVWIQDHIAIPPDDAEGSGGRYLDPLTTLAWLAGGTTRIGLGTGVLILPYRPALATAKAIATVQELSGGRLLLGVGIGWMQAEFRAVGVSRAQRGRISDETLDFIARCFADDVVRANGQEFLFLPRPKRPPIFVGGTPPHALERAARRADGWMPMGGEPEQLAPAIARLHQLAVEAGRPQATQVACMTAFDPRDPAAAAARARAFAEAGVTHLIAGTRYRDVDGFARQVDFLAEHLTSAR
jgi:probable F420-dependent oxidoreductase